MGQNLTDELWAVTVTGLTWLASHTFELRFQRPEGFDFLPGQKISIMVDDIRRDYSLIGATGERELAICVRSVSHGKLSLILARVKVGDCIHISRATGYFLFQPSMRPSVFVATGTGIAPFVAFARAGHSPSYMLHGVRTADELYYREILCKSAQYYRGCLSQSVEKETSDSQFFNGRVTDHLKSQLLRGVYDFYLCGRREMLRDATLIIDQRFAGSRIYSELFF